MYYDEADESLEVSVPATTFCPWPPCFNEEGDSLNVQEAMEKAEEQEIEKEKEEQERKKSKEGLSGHKKCNARS